jgi:glycosyltransferase involved in cell wall biosynthesis
MKVLFSDTTFSYLTPGGKQVHAEMLKAHLSDIGVEVNYENWHDPSINAEIVHFFGFNDFNKIKILKEKGYKLIYTHILDGITNQSKLEMKYHQIKNKFIRVLPSKLNPIFPWKALKYFDAIVYMHENDRQTGINLYNIPSKKTYVVPHAVDSLEKYKNNIEKNAEKYLVSLGSIIPRKNSIFLAKICKQNNIPIKFVGKPLDKNSAYFKEFLSLTDNKTVQYLGFLSEEEKIQILKQAAGFVLLSFGESGCISVYEAGATGLPLLLSDLPWAKGYENPNFLYYCSPYHFKKASNSLVQFYKIASRKKYQTFNVRTWIEIAEMYKDIYSSIL